MHPRLYLIDSSTLLDRSETCGMVGYLIWFMKIIIRSLDESSPACVLEYCNQHQHTINCDVFLLLFTSSFLVANMLRLKRNHVVLLYCASYMPFNVAEKNSLKKGDRCYLPALPSLKAS